MIAGKNIKIGRRTFRCIEKLESLRHIDDIYGIYVAPNTWIVQSLVTKMFYVYSNGKFINSLVKTTPYFFYNDKVSANLSSIGDMLKETGVYAK